MIYRESSGNLQIININDYKNDKIFYEYLMKIKK